jgi:hypothetical protein
VIYFASNATITRSAGVKFSESSFAGSKGKRSYSLAGSVLKAFSDDFNRGDSSDITTPTIAWRELSGDWQIVNNTIFTNTSPATYPLAAVRTGTRNAKIRINKGVAGWGWGVAFWVLDANNWHAAVIDRVTTTTYSCPTNTNVVTLSGTTCVYPPDYPQTDRTCTATNFCASGVFYNGGCYSCPCGGFNQGGCWYNCGWLDIGADSCGCCPGGQGTGYCQTNPVNYPGKQLCDCTVNSIYHGAAQNFNYACPYCATNANIVTGPTNGMCIYPADYAATATSSYANQIIILRAVSGVVSVVGTSTALVTNINVRPDYVNVETLGTTATITAPMDDSSGTIEVLYNAAGASRGTRHGVLLASTTATQATNMDNFTYEPL